MSKRYLVVGSGLSGSIAAYRLKNDDQDVSVIEARNHLAGNIYTEYVNGIQVHKYGPHVFHTSDKEVWDFVGSLVTLIPFQYSPLVQAPDGNLYNLPFNLHTFHQVYGINTPKELKNFLDTLPKVDDALDIDSFGRSRLGDKMYELLVKGYTEKQWGKESKDLPSWILGRLPIREVWNNNYFNDLYQGIPKEGYTKISEKLLSGIPVTLGKRFTLSEYQDYDKIIYTGAIDELCDYCFGELDWRGLKFKEEYFSEINNYQGIPVINNSSPKTPYTRTIEHKHFLPGALEKSGTVVTKEFPEVWSRGKEKYYPIETEKNIKLYWKYREFLEENYPNIILLGRLAEYHYYDMDKIIKKSLTINLYD